MFPLDDHPAVGLVGRQRPLTVDQQRRVAGGIGQARVLLVRGSHHERPQRVEVGDQAVRIRQRADGVPGIAQRVVDHFRRGVPGGGDAHRDRQPGRDDPGDRGARQGALGDRVGRVEPARADRVDPVEGLHLHLRAAVVSGHLRQVHSEHPERHPVGRAAHQQALVGADLGALGRQQVLRVRGRERPVRVHQGHVEAAPHGHLVEVDGAVGDHVEGRHHAVRVEHLDPGRPDARVREQRRGVGRAGGPHQESASTSTKSTSIVRARVSITP